MNYSAWFSWSFGYRKIDHGPVAGVTGRGSQHGCGRSAVVLVHSRLSSVESDARQKEATLTAEEYRSCLLTHWCASIFPSACLESLHNSTSQPKVQSSTSSFFPVSLNCPLFIDGGLILMLHSLLCGRSAARICPPSGDHLVVHESSCRQRSFCHFFLCFIFGFWYNVIHLKIKCFHWCIQSLLPLRPSWERWKLNLVHGQLSTTKVMGKPHEE